MVVGIRQTSSETSTATLGTLPRAACGDAEGGERLQRNNGQQEDQRQSGNQNIQRDLVRRLLPLGAFDQRDHAIQKRLARIRRDPDFDLVGEHRVPPVTALRSPPDSRMTGALSPVITDSSTVAIPSMTSPSPGIRSPALAAQRRRRPEAPTPELAPPCRSQ